MTMPMTPTTSGEITSIEIQRFTPRSVKTMTDSAPIMRNSPWAKLMTRIMPKMTASPVQSRARLATEKRMSIVSTAARSIRQARERTPCPLRGQVGVAPGEFAEGNTPCPSPSDTGCWSRTPGIN